MTYLRRAAIEARNGGVWLSRVDSGSCAAARLFCFPYAGAGASLFGRWAERLPRGVDVLPVHLPGREMRLWEQPFTQLTELVAALAEGLGPYLDKPFAFLGHSVGALVCFELARYLRRTHDPVPAHLYVSGRRAPQCEPPRKAVPVHRLSDHDLVGELRRLNGTPDQALDDPELMAIALPAVRADFAVEEGYQYEADAPLSCPITAFGGLADGEVTYADLNAWSAQTSAAFRLHLLPGDHFFVKTERERLLELLSRELSGSIWLNRTVEEKHT